MNTIIQNIRASEVPVVVYVSPRGAIAGSAGTLITLAGHFGVMAPETAIGAASPVGAQGEEIAETLATKQKEILKASVRSLAENRSEEAILLAEETIETARAVSANEALSVGLIDYIATDLNDLLTWLDGKSVTLLSGEKTIQTDELILDPLRMTFIEQLLQLLTNPNILFLLLTIGVQAVFIELSNPGGWVAGFIGAVCLILAIYGLGILPVNWFGILFLVVAFILFILEIKTPTMGGLTVAGVVSFAVGALVLFNNVETAGFQGVSIPLVVGTSIFLGIGVFIVLSFALRALREPVKTGMETLIGRSGYVVSEITNRGSVQVAGEQWSAISFDGKPIPEGASVIVKGKNGINLIVDQLEN
jgi:membrane-bound serine protease (ClpP class)